MAIQQFSESLPMMLYRSLDAVMPRFRLIFNEFGLTEQQWRVLRVLWEHDEIGFRAVAELTLIPAPSLVGVVDRLHDNGLVDRRRSQTDRRNVFLFATAEGRALHERVMPRVDATYRELTDSISPRVWQQLMEGLREVSELGPPAAQDKHAANG